MRTDSWSSSLFHVRLGGLLIQAAASGLALTAVPAEEDAPFVSSPASVEAAEADIHIHFMPFSRQDAELIPVDRPLLVLGQSALHKLKNGGYAHLPCPPDGGSPTWMLTADANFSRFDCFLDANELLDPHKQAANRLFLQHSFIKRDGLIIHAAGGSFQGKGIVFAAPSGTGKSTLSRLLQAASPQHRLFSEERLIIRSADDGWRVWGTPWRGTGSIARNESAPLAALVFLSQAQTTKLSELPASAALRRLFQVASIPWHSEEWAAGGLAVCEALLRGIPAFELAFRPDQSAAQAVDKLAASLA